MGIESDYPAADRACRRWVNWLLSDRNNLGYASISSTGRVCDILRTGVVPDSNQRKSSIAASVVGYQDDVAERVQGLVAAMDTDLQRVLMAQYTGRVDGKHSNVSRQLCKMLGISHDTYYRRLRIALQRIEDDITSRAGYIVA